MVKIDDLLHQFISILFNPSSNINKDKALKKMLFANIKESLDSWTNTVNSWKHNLTHLNSNQSVDSKKDSNELYSDSYQESEFNNNKLNITKDYDHSLGYNSAKKFEEDIFEKVVLWDNGINQINPEWGSNNKHKNKKKNNNAKKQYEGIFIDSFSLISVYTVYSIFIENKFLLIQNLINC